MKLPGLPRILQVYPLWTLISLLLLSFMIFFELRVPTFLFALTLFYILKDIFLDTSWLKIDRPRVYWVDHAPTSLLIAIIGIFDLLGIALFQGYVGMYTTLLASISFVLDFILDLLDHPSVYGK